MPCPEKFKETMVTFGIPKEIIDDINTGLKILLVAVQRKKRLNTSRELQTFCAPTVLSILSMPSMKRMPAVKAEKEKKNRRLLQINIKSYLSLDVYHI